MDENNYEVRYRRLIALSLPNLIVASLALKLLYDDFFRTGALRFGDPLAKVESFEAKVRHRSHSDLVWEDVKPNEKLYLKDSLETGPGSEAEIRLKDGTLVEVRENSFVIIDEVAGLSLPQWQGSFLFHGENGDQSITVGADRKPVIRAVPVRLLAPGSGSVLYTREATELPVGFQWKTTDAQSKEEAGTALEITSDRAFAASQTRVLPAANAITVPLASGHYFWRVRPGKGEASEIRNFRVEPAVAITLSTPLSGQTIELRPDHTAEFRWIVPRLRPPGEHFLEVAREAGFEHPLSTSELALGTGLTRLALEPGHYFWRIRSRYPNLPIASPAQEFTAVQAAAVGLRLDNPPDGSALQVPKQLAFAWSSDDADARFTLELQDAHTQKPVWLQQTGYPGALWKSPAIGEYRWRILATTAGSRPKESAWFSLQLMETAAIALREPIDHEAIRYWDPQIPLKMAWTGEVQNAQVARSFRVEISKSPAFTDLVLTRETKEPFLNLRGAIGEGHYSWRVRLVDAAGKVLGSSGPGDFFFGPYPILAAPSQLKPLTGTQLKFLGRDGVVHFSWDGVENATGYQITLKNENGISLQKLVVKPAADLRKLEGGTYQWTAQAIDRLRRLGHASEPLILKVEYEPLDAPQMVEVDIRKKARRAPAGNSGGKE